MDAIAVTSCSGCSGGVGFWVGSKISMGGTPGWICGVVWGICSIVGSSCSVVSVVLSGGAGADLRNSGVGSMRVYWVSG